MKELRLFTTETPRHNAARRPQPKRDSPGSPSPQNLNTESTESLSGLRVKALPVTEGTEYLRAKLVGAQRGSLLDLKIDIQQSAIDNHQSAIGNENVVAGG